MMLEEQLEDCDRLSTPTQCITHSVIVAILRIVKVRIHTLIKQVLNELDIKGLKPTLRIDQMRLQKIKAIVLKSRELYPVVAHEAQVSDPAPTGREIRRHGCIIFWTCSKRDQREDFRL